MDGSSTGTPSNGDPFALRLLMRTLNVVAWIREQWLLWLMLLSIFAAYFSPVVLALSITPIIASICTGVTFFLTGLTLPIADLKSLPKQWMPMLLVVGHCFVVAPLLGWAFYAIPMASSEASNRLLLAGYLCVCVMPTPMLVSTIATAAAGGSESVSQGLSVIVNLLGLIFVSPLGVQLVLRNTDALTMPSSESIPSFVWMFLATTLAPLLGGHSVQHLLYSSSFKHLIASDEHLKRQLTSATVTCSEVCDTTHSNWRNRARQLSVGTLLFLNYVIFSGLFHHSASVTKEREMQLAAAAATASLSPGGGAVPVTLIHGAALKDKNVTWEALGIISLAIAVTHLVQAVASWFTTGWIGHVTPEERIAVYFLCFQKTELLAIPLIVQTCGCIVSDPKAAALLVLPSLVTHCVQSILGGMLTPSLRQWRNRQHCKPGTTLLPLKYTKTAKHAPPQLHGSRSGYLSNNSSNQDRSSDQPNDLTV